MTSLIGPESMLVAITLLIAVLFPKLLSGWFGKLENTFRKLAKRRALSIFACGIGALIIRAAALPIMPVPVPVIQDEFSYLLAGDTFAHGRLTNPTPPMWEHFEQLHVLYEPTYASKYPPMQGLMLALGTIIAGHPFVGVWLSVGMLCAAICWMLQAWMPPHWALLGGLLAVLRLSLSYWDNSYWGGAIAGIGGALVLGALPRILRSQRTTQAILIALGLGILANSRPYEGLILALPVGFVLLLWMIRACRFRNLTIQIVAVRVVAPAAVVLALVAACMGLYFQRVTGSVLVMPYQLHQHQYSVAPYFIWQRPNPVPAYRHAVIARYYLRAELPHYQELRTPLGFLGDTAIKTLKVWTFYIGPALTIPLWMLPWIVRDRRIRLIVAIAITCFLTSILTTFFFPHYVAPATCVIYALVVQGIRHLYAMPGERRICGKFLSRAAVGVSVVMMPVQLLMQAQQLHSGHHASGTSRAEVLSQLCSRPGNQVAIVRYRADHPALGNEWVDNLADIEHAKVVWARDMGGAENEALLRHYKDRQAWLVEPDETPPRISEYAEPKMVRTTER